MHDTDLMIEPLQPASLSEYVKLTKAYFLELDLVPEFHALDQDMTQPLTAYAPPRGGLWLAKTGEPSQPVGMVGVMPLAKRTCELRRLYVVAGFRHRAWGQKLLEHAVAFARETEYFEILAALHHDQKSALDLLEKAGFKPCARFREHQHAGIFLSLKLGEV